MNINWVWNRRNLCHQQGEFRVILRASIEGISQKSYEKRFAHQRGGMNPTWISFSGIVMDYGRDYGGLG